MPLKSTSKGVLGTGAGELKVGYSRKDCNGRAAAVKVCNSDAAFHVEPTRSGVGFASDEVGFGLSTEGGLGLSSRLWDRGFGFFGGLDFGV